MSVAGTCVKGKDGEVNLPLRQKKSTARSGSATKDRDAGLAGKGDRDTRTWKPGATKTNAKSGRGKPRHYKKRRKEWRDKLAAKAEKKHSQEWLCHQLTRCRAEARRYETNAKRGESSAEQVAVFLKSGPGDRTIRELHSDAEAIVVGQLLTINDLPEGSGGMQGSNAYHIAGLPGLLREYAGAVRADVIGEGLLSIGRRAYQRREAHDDDNRQPPFDAASGAVVQRYLAQTLTRYLEAWRRADSGADVYPVLRG